MCACGSAEGILYVGVVCMEWRVCERRQDMEDIMTVWEGLTWSRCVAVE